MKITVTFNPEDGTGPLTKSYTVIHPSMQRAGLNVPDHLWYALVKCMKEIILTWRWTKAGKPSWEEKEKRLAWKTEAREWTEPIDVMIAATKNNPT